MFNLIVLLDEKVDQVIVIINMIIKRNTVIIVTQGLSRIYQEKLSLNGSNSGRHVVCECSSFLSLSVLRFADHCARL